MKTLEAHELAERINEILRLVEEEGETIEVTNRGKVVARLVPEHRPQQSVERNLDTFWANIDQLAAEIGAYAPKSVDAVEIVRDGRREL